MGDADYLERIGAARLLQTDGLLHPTAAGLLMFGDEYKILYEYPEYFLDFREVLDPEICWTDRLQSSSGDWTGNLFDFFFRVYGKLVKEIKVPFKLDGVSIVLENPGSIRTGKKQMLKGGISDPRNKALMKMFNMIGIGERAGSGVPDIYSVWESQGWVEPIVIEEYSPDRTILKLSFVNARVEKVTENSDRKKVTEKLKCRRKLS